DWRMALDLARLALDAGAAVDFTAQHWEQLAATAAPLYFRALGGTVRTFGGLPAVQGVRNEVVVHPLWADAHPSILQARSEASAAGIPRLDARTLFELVRRPF